MAPTCCGCGSEEVIPTSSIFPLCSDCAPLVDATPITEESAVEVPEPVETGGQE